MKYTTYIKIRILIGLLIAAIVVIAVSVSNFYLAITGVLIGVLFMFLAKTRFKEVVVDERVVSVSGKASRVTYVIATLFFAVLGLFFILCYPGEHGAYMESMGILFNYVAMFLIAVYSISYYYINKKYGGDQ